MPVPPELMELLNKFGVGGVVLWVGYEIRKMRKQLVGEHSRLKSWVKKFMKRLGFQFQDGVAYHKKGSSED